MVGLLYILADCPAGQYRNAINEECMNCSRGFYQPEIRQDECLPCGDNYTTESVESKEKSDCKRELQVDFSSTVKFCIPSSQLLFPELSFVAF